MKVSVTHNYTENGKKSNEETYDDMKKFYRQYPLVANIIRVYESRFEKLIFDLDTESLVVLRIG